MGVITVLTFLVAVTSSVDAQFGVMPPIFGPHPGNIMQGIQQMISNIGQMASQMPAGAGTFITTNDLAPGQHQVLNDGNMRGFRFRSADGTSSGFSFHTGGGGGSGMFTSFGPGGQVMQRYIF